MKKPTSWHKHQMRELSLLFERGVVVDTWVLARASDSHCPEFLNAVNVLQKLFEKCFPVMVDRTQGGSRIIKEYRAKATALYGAEWFKAVSRRRRKLRKIGIRKPAPRNSVHDKYDRKFVAVCLNSSANSIITEEPDFVEAEGRLRKLGVNVLSLEDALQFL